MAFTTSPDDDEDPVTPGVKLFGRENEQSTGDDSDGGQEVSSLIENWIDA